MRAHIRSIGSCCLWLFVSDHDCWAISSQDNKQIISPSITEIDASFEHAVLSAGSCDSRWQRKVEKQT